jgi:hypothetical protein
VYIQKKIETAAGQDFFARNTGSENVYLKTVEMMQCLFSQILYQAIYNAERVLTKKDTCVSLNVSNGSE